MSTRNKYLLRRFGIDETQYEELLKKQRGSCAICQKDAREFAKRLAVDHCHKTREIRGLLCFYCNRRRVGRSTKEDIPALQRVINYLRQGTGWLVPVKRKKRRKKRR